MNLLKEISQLTTQHSNHTFGHCVEVGLNTMLQDFK